ncbi:M56 family metallopeptidase [Pseudonocardia humida]|uniref:M56 family metallopeptidase n=1 Tax=Pseudonocardia humida TaxID=2800819 RepID=A0ABT1ABY1_9PSEU|nr:M56 family metallopeptidase [Pseudonocardia humida]MCO1660550.1 M56 family metallopeptidase [Pseudonocardia humida]
MIYVWHHVCTALLAVASGAVLVRARWTHRSPHLAVLLWQATALGAVTATVGALLSAGLEPYGRGIVPALSRLGAELAAGAPHPGLGAGHVTAIVAGLLLTTWTATVQIVSSWRAGRHRSRHRLLLRLVGRSDAHERAVVLDHPVAAAYYLPGPSGCVVVSSGALEALTPSQLEAVLAHEDAHAREHHHLALAPFHALRRAVPCRLTARMGDSIELLVEMCADDGAARRHGPAPLIAALDRFHALGASPVPPGALAVGGHATAQRIDRLRAAHPPLSAPLRNLVVLAALAVGLTPLSLFVLPA